jgi:hypothetical protein
MSLQCFTYLSTNFCPGSRTGCQHAAQTFAAGVRNGLPQCSHGGPYMAIRW